MQESIKGVTNMNATEIIMQYHGEINKAVANAKSSIEKITSVRRIHSKYMTQLKAMLKAKVMSWEEYDYITDRMITLDADIYLA